MWPSTPARHPPAPVAAPVATAANTSNHPALPVIATVSTTEINDAKHAYKDMLRAASDMHVAMRALAQKARDFAAALHDFAHAVPGSVVAAPTMGRGDWSDDDVDDDGAGLGVRKYATLQTLLANGLDSSADKLEADFIGKLKANYAQHKNNIKANAEHYRAARDLHARQTKGLEKAMAESKKGLGANLLSSHRGSFSFSTAPSRHAAAEPADANEKYRETVHELARMATGLEIIKNHHFDSIMAEERRNLTYVSARCAEALALQCDLVWGKAYTFTFNAMEQWRARAPPSPSTLAHAARHHCASPSFGPAAGHHHHHHHRGRSASNATQCAAARIAAACDAAEAGMPALTAIPAAYAGLPPPPHSPAPATPITPGRVGARHRRGMSIATLRETLFPGTAGNGQGTGLQQQPPLTPLARPKTPVFVHAHGSAVSLHHHDGHHHHHHHRMSGVASPPGSGGRSRSNSMSAVYPAATAPPVVTDTEPDSYDTLVAPSVAHDEVGELRQRKWSVSTGVSVAISEYIVAGPHGGYAVPPMPPLPPTTMAAQR